jgi:hypothetical protein
LLYQITQLKGDEMIKQLELKKLLDQLIIDHIVTQTEPNRYIVNEGFKVYIFNQDVTEFQVSRQVIRVGYNEWYEYDDIVKYTLFKEI